MADKKKEIAIYGGAYDPPTNSHLTVAAEIVHSQCADEVWFCPCGPRPDKPNLSPPLKRLCMCELAVNSSFPSDFKVRVESIEVDKGEYYATYDLLNELKEKYTDCNFSFIVGTDWLDPKNNIASWDSKNFEFDASKPESDSNKKRVVTGHKLLAEHQFLVVPRPGYDFPLLANMKELKMQEFGSDGKAHQFNFTEGNLSATEVRKRIGAGRPQCAITGLVPRAVATYIEKHRLYRKRTVAIYGGAFDPPTATHLTVAAEIVHSDCAHEVWFCPCGPRKDKPNMTREADQSSPSRRLAMCELAVCSTFPADFPVHVESIEVDRGAGGEALATYDLLCELKAKYPDCEFMFVIGSDLLDPKNNIAGWESKNPDYDPKKADGDGNPKTIVTGNKLLSEFDFLVVPRPGFDDLELIAGTNAKGETVMRMKRMAMKEFGGHLFKFTEGSLSATEVRKRVGTGREIFPAMGLVANGVGAFIERHGLYK